jgi:hypothetical protein
MGDTPQSFARALAKTTSIHRTMACSPGFQLSREDRSAVNRYFTGSGRVLSGCSIHLQTNPCETVSTINV